jgi:hypothetical protein
MRLALPLAGCGASPALASLDDQYQCRRHGKVEAIVIPSSMDPTRATIQFAGPLATIPSIALQAQPVADPAIRSYASPLTHGRGIATRFVMGTDTGKLYFRDFFANCDRVPQNEQDLRRQQRLPARIELDRRGLSLVKVGSPSAKLEFGATKEQVLAFTASPLDVPPRRSSGSECPRAPEAIAFGPLVLRFRARRWVGWTLLQNRPDPAPTISIATAEGIRLGQGDLSALVPSERIEESTLGREYHSEGVSYLLASNGDALRSAWAGAVCVFR